ncbi:ABC transporter ATP-binding protein [Nocardia jiangsuensis]|uniref:ATP-binding cassette domain-containing protein n=1 Tax=Nocardia jiangsuensis TaxID=1691563 RepID=A0ABV8DNA5_9NOCA
MVTAAAPPPRALDTDPAVAIQNLSKRFGATLAVDDLTLEVRPGEVFGFLGPNGAGKSTTIRCLLGMIRPGIGSVRVFGDDAADVRRAHRHLAYVPADVALWPALTGAEILHLIAATGPGADPGYRAELIERFALDTGKPAKTYSTGNRQKVALIAAFASRAPLLVLDEPTSGLDPLMEHQFRACVEQARERGQTVFLSSHQLGEVEALCDRVAILRAGRLVQIATLAELRRLHRSVVEIIYDDRPPALAGVEGVESVETLDTHRLRFTLTGTAAPALRVLADAGVTSLSSREPSLEEIFLGYYGQAAR